MEAILSARMGAEKAGLKPGSAQPHQEREPSPCALAPLSSVEISKVPYDSFCDSDRGRKTRMSKSNFQMCKDLAV